MRLLWVFVFVLAQPEFRDEEHYKEQMQEIDHAFAVMRENTPVRKGPEVEREAARLSTLFDNVEAFWKARGDEEAASFARMASDGAEKAGRAARHGDSRSYEAALDVIAASCEGCHEDPLDKYRFRSLEGAE